MLIEGLDLMGLMPDGSSEYQAQVNVQSVWGDTSIFNGTIQGSLNEYEDKGWGSLGFSFPVFAFPEFGFSENSMSMEWSYVWEDDDDVSFSYGLATWTGSMADEVGASELCLGWLIIETTVPAPGTLALLGLAAIG